MKPLAIIVALAGTAAAQSVVIDLTGVEIRDGLDEFRDSSPETMVAASGYAYDVDAMVEGTSGAMALLFPDPTPLGDVFDYFEEGQSRVLNGVVRNPGGSIPTPIYREGFVGSLAGFDIAVNFEVGIDGSSYGTFELFDIDFAIPLLVGRGEIVSGTTTISVWEPTPPVETEWHFDGDLSEVAGPSRLRYLDDPAFGPPPNVSFTGVTEAQSAYGTTTSFGIAGIDGEEATVYRTSPPRNASDPSNPDASRPIGLVLYPRTADFYPDDQIGHWTMIWDVYVPSASFDETFAVPFLNDNADNENDCDMFLHNDLNDGPGIGYGYEFPLGDYIRTPLLQADTWMRIALVSDGFSTRESRLFIDGTFIGTSGSGWLYNQCDPTDPRDELGNPIDSATWDAWGQFPNPWHLPEMSSTLTLFSDDTGEGESVYVANMYLTDRLLTDAEVAALGDSDAAGIVMTGVSCPADLNGDTVLDIFDVLDFLARFDAGDGSADWNGDTVLDIFDVLGFLSDFDAGC